MVIKLLKVPVIQRVYNATQWINHYPVDSVVCFTNSAVPLGKDLSGGYHYPPFEQVAPDEIIRTFRLDYEYAIEYE